VLPEEYLYYGVRVQAGQRLHVTANSELDRDEWSALNVAFVAVNVASPDRDQIVSDIDGDQSFTSSDESGADFTTPPATTVAKEDDTSIEWTGPCVYFLSFYPAYAGGGAPPKAEIPFHFEIALEGTAETEPAATPVTTPTPRPRRPHRRRPIRVVGPAPRWRRLRRRGPRARRSRRVRPAAPRLTNVNCAGKGSVPETITRRQAIAIDHDR
jgi:hypothetical protein